MRNLAAKAEHDTSGWKIVTHSLNFAHEIAIAVHSFTVFRFAPMKAMGRTDLNTPAR